MATRVQHAKKMTKLRVAKKKRNIGKCIDGMFSFEYKKKDGSWNIAKIARDSGTSRNTVYKYVNK